MSSGEEFDGTNLDANVKRRKVNRACDVCRRKKIRCNGAQTTNNRCSNCAAFGYECTYVQGSKKPAPSSQYVESLERKLKQMEDSMRKLRTSGGPSQEPSTDPGSTSSPGSSASSPPRIQPAQTTTSTRARPIVPSATPMGPTLPSFTPPNPSIHNPESSRSNRAVDDSEYLYTSITARDQIGPDGPPQQSFLGRSGPMKLVRSAMGLKIQQGSPAPDIGKLRRNKPAYWETPPWEAPLLEQPYTSFEFPEPDLLQLLVEEYFHRVNPFHPLFHRTIFEKQISEGLHLSSNGFASVLLLVCAVAARGCPDPRVLLDGIELSAGWRWFQQVEAIKRPLFADPTLYDLQIHALTVLYLQGSSRPIVSWQITGAGIRLAQDAGAHSRTVYNSPPTAEDELWKRAFWVLVHQDRLASAVLGRPCALQDEDIDIDLPCECDDEFWITSDPNKAFKQPTDKPSQLSYFIQHLKLTEILAHALRTIYTLKKASSVPGYSDQNRDQHIIVDLDSALNKWVDALPDHLRWDPHREDPLFFEQSAYLHTFYYHVQIMLHRPFVTTAQKQTSLSVASVAICTNAARSSCHVSYQAYKRSGGRPSYRVVPVLFASGLVLILSIWGGKHVGLSIDPEKEMVDVMRCIEIIRACASRYINAGRLCDILHEIATAGDLPLAPTGSQKRRRGFDGASEHEPPPQGTNYQRFGSSSGSSSRVDEARRMPTSQGSSRGPASSTSNSVASSPSPMAFPPTRSEELAKMPLFSEPNVFPPPAAPFSTSAQNLQTQPPMYTPSGVDNIAHLGTSMGDGISHGFGSQVPASYVSANPLPAFEDSLGQYPQEQTLMNASAFDMQSQMLLHSDAFAAWSQAPSALLHARWDDWETLIANMYEPMQGPQQ